MGEGRQAIPEAVAGVPFGKEKTVTISLAGEQVHVDMFGDFSPEFIRVRASKMIALAGEAEKVRLKRVLANREAKRRLTMSGMEPGTLWYNANEADDFYLVALSFGHSCQTIWSLARGTHSDRATWESEGVDFRRVEINPGEGVREYTNADHTISIH